MSAGVVAQTVLPWRLVSPGIGCSDITKKETVRTADGPPPEYVTTFLVSKAWKLTRARKLVGVNKFTPENGAFRTGFSLETGGGFAMTWADTAKKWLCTYDHLDVVSYETGECVQTQTWEHNTPFVVVDELEWIVEEA